MELDFSKYQEADRRRIAKAIAKAIDQSFVTDSCRMTTDEVRRRFTLCARLFHEMCLESGWGLGRFEDSITEQLRRELNGQRFAGSRLKNSWVTAPEKTLIPKDPQYEMTSEGIYIPRDL